VTLISKCYKSIVSIKCHTTLANLLTCMVELFIRLGWKMNILVMILLQRNYQILPLQLHSLDNYTMKPPGRLTLASAIPQPSPHQIRYLFICIWLLLLIILIVELNLFRADIIKPYQQAVMFFFAGKGCNVFHVIKIRGGGARKKEREWRGRFVGRPTEPRA